MKMAKKDGIKLNKDEYAIFTDIKDSIKVFDKILDSNKEIDINGFKLKPSKVKTMEVVAYDQMIKTNICTVIVNDSITKGLPVKSSFLNLNYKKDKY